MFWFHVAIVSAAAFRCVLSASTPFSNVQDNHRLFSGKMPHPSVFGLTGYTPMSSVPAGKGEGFKIYPDLANAEGTGAFVDYTWKLHGIPSYAYTEFKLSNAHVEHNSYRIVESSSLQDDSDAVGRGDYKIVRIGVDAPLEKRLECRGGDTPPAPGGSPPADCHTNHAATLEDCAPIYYLMKREAGLCRDFDQEGRSGATYRSCGYVAQRGSRLWPCISYTTLADLALPIVDQCWPRDGPHPCTNWKSGVIEATDITPKTCVCNNQSVGKC